MITSESSLIIVHWYDSLARFTEQISLNSSFVVVRFLSHTIRQQLRGVWQTKVLAHFKEATPTSRHPILPNVVIGSFAYELKNCLLINVAGHRQAMILMPVH